MAVVYAVNNGNWSDPTTWNTGQLPQPGDTVCANGYTVTIDQDVDLWVNGQPAGIITTREYSPAVAGGGFTCSRNNTTIRCQQIEAWSTALTISGNGCVVYADVYGSNHPSTQYLYGIFYTGPGLLQIYGAVYGGAGAAHHYGVVNNSSGTVQITGTVSGGSGSHAYGVNNASSGTAQITGNVSGGSGSHAYGVNNASSGTVQITGNVSGGSGYESFGVRNGSSGTVQITGDCVPQASTNAAAVWNHSTGIVYINGTVYSGRNASCVYANNGFIRINGDLRHHESLGNAPAIGTSSAGLIVLDGNIRHHYGTTGPFGLSLLATGCRLLMHDAVNTFTEYAEHNGNWLPTGNPAIHYGTALHEGSMPSPSDVRHGVSYGPDDIYTGTCRVPPPESVLYGVPVDDTVGTAAVTPEAIAAAVWNAARDSYSDSGTFGAVGEWAGGGGGGSDWTDEERAQIRHRLGIDGTSSQPQSATPSLAPATAEAVWSHTTRTLTAATTDWTDAERQQIRHRLGIDGQAAQPQSATPSLMAAGGYTAERAQRLDHVDAAVSSRLAATAYVAPDNTAIAAIKTQTDKLRFTGSSGQELVLASATADVDEEAIARAVAQELREGHLVSVVVQPIVARALLAAGDGGVLLIDRHERLVGSWQVLNTDLRGHDLRLIVYNDAAQKLAEYGDQEITVSYHEPHSVVTVNGPDTKTPSPGRYRWKLTSQTADRVLLRGRLIVEDAPDAA